jgi:hypothetical protein
MSDLKKPTLKVKHMHGKNIVALEKNRRRKSQIGIVL